jgi:hypothetical protein
MCTELAEQVEREIQGLHFPFVMPMKKICLKDIQKLIGKNDTVNFGSSIPIVCRCKTNSSCIQSHNSDLISIKEAILQGL